MDKHILHTRLAALAIGVGLAACAITLVCLLFPAQSETRPGVDYGYVYSGVKSSSVEFVEAAMTEESLMVLGSSELSTPRRLVPQVPVQVFGKADYGVRLMLIGEAFDQSLWHAIALGAYQDAGIPRNKVVLIVTPGWFVDGGQDSDTFKTRFSYSLYSRFNANANVPEEAKRYVRNRLEQLGIDETTISSVNPSLPQDYLNALALKALDDLKLRQGLISVRDKGIELVDEDTPSTPDFESLRKEAEQTGAEMSTTNDWGVEDGFYTGQLEPALTDAEGSRAGETYTDTPEYDDLDCFLDIADACGIEVLVVLSPEMGPYYDYIGISKDVRSNCYERVRSIVNDHNAQIADFSDREYEKYFLYEIVHFGWTGWVDVEKSIYEFAQDGA